MSTTFTFSLLALATLGLGGLAATTAFGQPTKPTPQQKGVGISLANIDQSVAPCEDFYHYANGNWLKNNPVPAAETRWGAFNELADRNIAVEKRILMKAAADRGGWDRDLLECSPGRPRRVRQADAGSGAKPSASEDGQVVREDGSSKGRYLLEIAGHQAMMTYSRAGEAMIIIDHTEVPAALRGRKVGERLVRQAVDDARQDGVAIVPLCPFAKAQFDRHPEWQDVLRRS